MSGLDPQVGELNLADFDHCYGGLNGVQAHVHLAPGSGERSQMRALAVGGSGPEMRGYWTTCLPDVCSHGHGVPSGTDHLPYLGSLGTGDRSRCP